MQPLLLSFQGITLSLILISAWGILFLLYQVIKQQGRLLLRLDGIERGLGANKPEAAQAMPTGLAIGTPFPDFKLPNINGKDVSLEDFHGKKVFLVNWNPGCGFCDLIAPELAMLQVEFHKRNVQLALVAFGGAEANRKLAVEHGLECPILLQQNPQDVRAFQNFGTPVAYLLDEQGRVAEFVAVGADQSPALARKVAMGRQKSLPGKRTLSDSRIERDGIKAGTPAPSFDLPDIHGRTVTLKEYRGKRVLLVFSDPHCGPCDQLAPHLVRLHKQHRANNLAVIMVGRGDPEENRRKANDYNIDFPVVLQDRWKLSKEYGIFATPVGFLIDENGVIARNVGKGADAILALANEGLAVSIA